MTMYEMWFHNLTIADGEQEELTDPTVALCEWRVAGGEDDEAENGPDALTIFDRH